MSSALRRIAFGGLVALVASGAAGEPAASHLELGAATRAESCWRDRSRDFAATGRVDPEPARCALEAWSEARRAEPARLDLAFREMEALWFAAHFAAADEGQARGWLDRAVAVADAVTAEIDRRAAASGSGAAHAASETIAARAERLRAVPEAGEAEFWIAISWAEWAVAHGGLAAATHGAIGRMHEAAELAALLGPEVRDGGGLRLLGRIHATAPRVPFVTGWVDRERGLELLRRAHALSTRDPRNPYFLAEALLDRRPQERETALALLREVAARVPDPSELVEQSETIAAARTRLARETGSR